jgi:tRNA-splicing ligase RtcB
MPIARVLTQGRVPVKIYTDDVSDNAVEQLVNVSQLPFVHHHVAAMPDVHWGMGATIGSVIPTVGAIIPAAVGVDIGCGMNALRLTLTAGQLPDSLAGLRSAIEAAVPVGMAGHADGDWRVEGLARVAPGLKPILAKHPQVSARWESQLGSLGDGNHFIELCLDEAGHVWIMLHSGSRGIGNRIGMHFIDLAKREMEGRHIRPACRAERSRSAPAGVGRGRATAVAKGPLGSKAAEAVCKRIRYAVKPFGKGSWRGAAARRRACAVLIP